MCESIIDRLFDGQADPYDHLISKKYYQMFREFGKTADQLSETLCPQQKKEFDKALEGFAAVCRRENQEMFYTGFCMGARIMMEVLQYAL